jgi:hypothetical protein
VTGVETAVFGPRTASFDGLRMLVSGVTSVLIAAF